MLLKSKISVIIFCNLFVLNNFCLSDVNSISHKDFQYRLLLEQDISYNATMIDSYQVQVENGENTSVTERVESKVIFGQSVKDNNAFHVTVELNRVFIDNKEIIGLNEENRTFSMVFNLNETGGLVLSNDSEKQLKDRIKNGDDLMVYFGRSIRAFFLARFSLPDKKSDQGNGNHYEWEADLDFGLTPRNLIFRGLLLNGKINIMGYSNLKDYNDTPIRFSAAPEKISAIFADGVIHVAEYSATIGNRTMVVRAKLITEEQR